MSLVRRSVKAAGVYALVHGLAAGCGSSDDDGEAAPECPRGSETCGCYRDSTCDDGLSCFSEVCVDADPPGDPTGGRSGTTTGGRGNMAGAAPNGGHAGNGTLPDGGEPDSGTPTGGASEPGENGGSGGAPSTPQGGGGAGGTPSDGGEPGTAGGAPSGGSGGTTATGGRSAEPTGGRVDPPSGTPTVLLLLDGSSSMFEPRTVWDSAFEALMSEDGPVSERQAQIRFGFSLYRGAVAMHEETDEACADISSVDFAFDNYEAIKALYETLDDDYDVTVKWETPTGHAITRATEALLADSADGPRYIVLITDGNPNTCATLDPQCGQDRAIYAVQRAWQQGIETFAIGLGDVVTNPLSGGCQPEYSRCGPEHLQDVANAGQGQPVVEPPEQYRYSGCVLNETEEYLASYAAEGGDATAYSTTTLEELKAAVSGVLERIVEHSQ